MANYTGKAGLMQLDKLQHFERPANKVYVLNVLNLKY